jgi:hypothetical protein
MNDERRKQLEQESIEGANALSEFKILNGAFVAIKAEIMDSFEKKETLDVEELQEVHRTYRNLAKIEDIFLGKIRDGKQAQNILNSKTKRK